RVRRVTVASGADAGHRASSAREFHERSARRAAAAHGPGRPRAGYGAARQGHGPRHLQPGAAPRGWLDQGSARPRRRLARKRLLGNLVRLAEAGARRSVIFSWRVLRGTFVARLLSRDDKDT